MRSSHILTGCCLVAGSLCIATAGWAQDSLSKKIEDRVNEAVSEIQEGAHTLAGQIREEYEKARAAVDRMGIAGRVYARIRWDKALSGGSVSVRVEKGGKATLRGTVPSEDARSKASQLAADTIGVESVVNELKVAPVAKR